MTTTRIQAHIARCIQIQQIMATLKAEEKEIKTKLIEEAEYRTGEHADTENGGWSWTYPDLDGNLARVTQPAPSLKSKLDPDGKAYPKVREIAGRSFMELFMQVPSYKPVEDFRKKAEIYLDRGDAKKLLKLVTTESAITVSFEVAQKEAA